MGNATFCSCELAEKDAAAAACGGLKLLSQQEGLPVEKSSGSDAGPTNIGSWEFDVLDLEDSEVKTATAWILLRKCDGGDYLREKFINFAYAAIDGYLPNPYHNQRHGLDVLFTVWRLGEITLNWYDIYRQQEQFALMVAAIAHDIGHFGLTNAFLVEVRDELAIHYNDNSPLENMHCNKLFHILALDETNVLIDAAAADYRTMRKFMIEAILYTDPIHHGPLIEDLLALYLDGGGTSENLRIAKNKTTVARTLMHAADLSNPCKLWKMTLPWAKKVMDEFFHQGDKEKEMGIPVGMLNDRTKVKLPTAQLGFAQFMVAPFVAAYTRIFPNWRSLALMLISNVERWARLHEEETGESASSRAQSVRVMVEAALAEETAESAEAKVSEELPLPDVTDELFEAPRVPAAALAASNAPFVLSNSEDTEQNCIVVREVRRWREQTAADTPAGGQYRELLLLYLLSDGAALDMDEDVVMKFNSNRAHFGDSSPLPTKLQGHRVLSVSAAADELKSQLSHADFDRLLSSLLEVEK